MKQKRLISDQSEILGPKTPKETTWRSTSLLCERAYQITNAEVYIFSDSVLCVGEMGDDPNAAWKNKIKWYSQNNHFKELNRIDGMNSSGKYSQDSRRWASSKRFKKLMEGIPCEPEHFNDRIIFMSLKK